MAFDSDVPAPFFTGAAFFLLPNISLWEAALCSPLSLPSGPSGSPVAGPSELLQETSGAEAEPCGAPAGGRVRAAPRRLLRMLLSWRKTADVQPADVTVAGLMYTELDVSRAVTAARGGFLWRLSK